MTMRVLVLFALLGASEAALRSAPLAVKRVNGHVQLSAQQQQTMHSGCVTACKPSPVESKCATACETAMYKCIDETGPNETPKDTEKCQGDVLKLFTDTKGLAKKEGGNATKAEAKKEKKEAKMLLELSDVDEDEENDSASSGLESSEDDASDSEVTDEQEEEDAAAKAEQENTDSEEESSGEEQADDSEDAEAGEDAEASEDSEESNGEEAEEGSEEEEQGEEDEEPMDEEADEEDSFVQVSRGSDDGDEEADIDVSKDEGEETKVEEKTNVDESEAEDDESDVTAHDNSGPHEDAGEEDKKEAPAPKAEKKEVPAPKAEEEESLMQVGSDWKPEHGSGFHLYEHPQGSTVVTPCPIAGHGAPESCGAYFAGKADGAKCPQISCPRALGVTMKLTCSGGCCPTCWAPDHVLAIDRHTSIDDAATVDSAPQAPSSCGGVKCFQLNCASGFTEGHVSGSCCYSCVPGR